MGYNLLFTARLEWRLVQRDCESISARPHDRMIGNCHAIHCSADRRQHSAYKFMRACEVLRNATHRRALTKLKHFIQYSVTIHLSIIFFALHNTTVVEL